MEHAVSPVYALRDSQAEALGHVEGSGDLSLKLRVETEFRKSLVLSAASFFEAALTQTVIELFEEGVDGNEMLVAFVRAKAVERRYHDWFAWDSRNANRFFGAFGDEFRDFAKAKIVDGTMRPEWVRAFLQLGQMRNELVHRNYVAQTVELTEDEVMKLHDQALEFVGSFGDVVREYWSKSGNGV